MVVVGIPADNRTSFSAAVARRKGLTISICRRMKDVHLPRAIKLVEAGAINLDGLVTERHRMCDWKRAFDGLVEQRGAKVVIEL